MRHDVCDRCKNVFKDAFRDEPNMWWCEECGDYCEDVDACSVVSTRYKVHVSVIMEADVYVYADSEDEACDKVDSGVYPIDYANETCGFETEFDIEDVTCDCNYMEIHDVEESEE